MTIVLGAPVLAKVSHDFMANTAANLIGGVIGGIILTALYWASRRAYRSLHKRRTEGKAAAAAAKAKTEAETLQVLREQVLEVAKAKGMFIPAKHQRVGAAIVVTYANGKVIEFYSDWAARDRDMQAGRASIQARVGTPTQPVSDWSEAKARDWLRENAD